MYCCVHDVDTIVLTLSKSSENKERHWIISCALFLVFFFSLPIMSDLKVDGFKVISPSKRSLTALIPSHLQSSDILAMLGTTFEGFTPAERAAQVKKVTLSHPLDPVRRSPPQRRPPLSLNCASPTPTRKKAYGRSTSRTRARFSRGP